MVGRDPFRVTGVVLLAIGLVSCQSDGADPSATFGDRYLASMLGFSDAAENEQVMVDYVRLEETAIERCMTSAGFEYVAAPAEAVFIPLGYPDDDADNAERLGFGISTIDASLLVAADNPNDAIIARLGGTPEGVAWNGQFLQCADVATAEVSEEYGVGRVAEVASSVENAVRADERVLRAERQWSDCMAKAGLLAANRRALIDNITVEFERVLPEEREQFTADEIAAALADAECGVELREVETLVSREALGKLSPADHEALFG